jgi:amidase
MMDDQMSSFNRQRRDILKSGLSLGVGSLIHPNISFAGTDPLHFLDATEQAKMIRSGQISALEMVMSAIERIELLNPDLNAVVTKSFEQAIDIAKLNPKGGPFSGVPYLVKDLLDQKGVRTTSGSRMFANRIANRNSSNVQAAFDMGLISLGKTNTPEFGLTGTTESLLLGTAKNPWNVLHNTGGSSGGSAAAVASGMVAIASASDGGGSIRVPASCCGIVGLKPSLYRTIDDAQPNRPIDLSVRFVHTRSVRDSATALYHMQQTDPSGKLPKIPMQILPNRQRLRIALLTTNMLGKEADSDVKNSIENTAALCEELGHQIEIIDPFIDGERFIDSFITMWAHGARTVIRVAEENFGRTDTVLNQLLEPWTLGLGQWFDRLPENHVEKALKRLKEDALKTKKIFNNYDVMLSPVVQTTAPKNGLMAPDIPYDQLLERSVNFITFTPLANVTGDPAMSLPLGWSSNGLPIGSHFHSSLGTEQLLLELALQLEEARPWKDKWPS